MNRVSVIQEIINQKKARTYLEIGVQGGSCFLKLKARKKIGVDPLFTIKKKHKLKSIFKNSTNLFNEYYEMTSDDFFNKKM